MRFVIDTNILIAALIKDSSTREVIFNSGWTFYYPFVAMEEIAKYKFLILQKSRLEEADYEILIRKLFGKIMLIEQSRINSFLDFAYDLIGKIDKKDVPFMALALSIPNDGLWTDDSDFEKQNEIKIWKTEDILRIFSDN